jgi:hypothetical protein
MEGIFLNGVPLKEAVQEIQDQEKVQEVREDVRTTNQEIRKSIYKGVSPESAEAFGHSRVKILTETEIKKDYPNESLFSGMLENLVFLLLQRGGMRGVDLAIAMKYEPRKYSGWISTTLIKANKWVPENLYKGPDGRWHVNGVSTVGDFLTKLSETKMKNKSIKKPPIQKNQEKPKEMESSSLLEKLITETLEKVIQSGLKIKVEVSGSVHIGFSFE